MKVPFYRCHEQRKICFSHERFLKMAFDNNFPSMPYTTLSSSYFNSCSSAHGAFMTISVPCTKLKFAPSILGTSWKMAFSSAV